MIEKDCRLVTVFNAPNYCDRVKFCSIEKFDNLLFFRWTIKGAK